MWTHNVLNIAKGQLACDCNYYRAHFLFVGNKLTNKPTPCPKINNKKMQSIFFRIMLSCPSGTVHCASQISKFFASPNWTHTGQMGSIFLDSCFSRAFVLAKTYQLVRLSMKDYESYLWYSRRNTIVLLRSSK